MITPSGGAERFPLTALQQSMVLASLREPRAGVYLIQDVCELAWEADPVRLMQACHLVARRHAALRTAIDHADGTQRVIDEPRFDWTELHTDDLPTFLAADRARGFRFANTVPMRFTLLGSRTLVWTCHHALLDGRSLGIVWRELLETYDALTDGRKPTPAPEPQGSGATETSGAEPYWRGYLAGLSQTIDFVVDRLRRQDGGTQDRIRESCRFSAEETQALEAFAANHDVTVNTLIQAAWALLLSRYSGRQDVVFGITRSCRGPEDRSVGLLINTLPFRVTVDEDTPLTAWLKAIREQWLGGRDYERTPLDKIREWSALPPGTPPFDTVLVYDRESPGDALRSAGRTSANLVRFQRTDSALALACTGRPLLTLDIAADGRLFSRETIARLAGHLRTLLVNFVSHEDGQVTAVSMLGPEEERWLVHEVNRTETPYPRELCMHRVFEKQAALAPEKIALDGIDTPISYGHLNARANRLAWVLREKGAGPEDLIALCFDPSPQLIAAVFAVLKCGAAFLPFHPDTPEARLAEMVDDARPKFILASEAHASKLSSCGSGLLTEQALHEGCRHQSADNLPDIGSPENAAYAIYTSGSTGRPKASVIVHRSLVNYTAAARRSFDITESDRRIQFASPGADLFIAEVFNYLSFGATLVFGPPGLRSSATEFLRALNERRITITGLPSTWWSECVAAVATGAAVFPRSLRAVIVGMEQMNPASLQAWNRMAGSAVRLFNDYGPTEACCTATVYETGTSEWEGASFVPIGKPMANMKVFILDSRGRPVPVGVAGDICIGGCGVGRGYLNRADLTEQKFVRDPFSDAPAARMYRTGDLGFRLPDGNLVFAGRVDRQVKIRGHRVELEEIEAVLAQQPGVLQCAVVLDDSSRLIAYVAGDAVADLRSRLAQYLPAHMIPANCVPVAAIPRTASGKLDRGALPRVQASSVPCAEPETPTQKRLAAIWYEILGVERAGITECFFSLGGDSLRATRLITRIYSDFGFELPFAVLLRKSTIAQLAALLDSSMPANPAESVLPLHPGGTRRPLFLVSSCATDLQVFRHLGTHLQGSQPLLAIGAPTASPRLQTVEDMAAEVFRSVREVSPHGPYVLGGYCFGGLLAFEAARQIIAAGEEVRLLVLFDTPAPGYPRVHRVPLRRYGGTRVRDMVRHAGRIARIARERATARTMRLAIGAGAPVPAANRIDMAARIYRPRPLAVRIAHFIAGAEEPLDDSRPGWRELCRGTFQTLAIAGAHANLLEEPHAAAIASLLTALLDEVSDRVSV